MPPAAKKRSANRDELLREWIDEIRSCFHQLGAAATDIHSAIHLTGAGRAVLESLVRFGDQTVPQMASARPVSRQHIQTIVDALIEDGLVESVANPAHRRSSLIALTAKGRRTMAAATVREREALQLLGTAFSEDELRQSIELTARLRRLAAERPWRAR